MLTKLSDWFDDRTGYKATLHEALFERIPGGARWRYVWGSTLVFAFVTQLITGIFLWMHYSPSTQTAWESVYYIEHEMTGGWLLRGVHHFMAQAMIVLMAIHLMQVVIDGAYRAPREINFWLGLLLMLTVFGLGLTGYLLPWDQKGYWATKVATNIAGVTPVVGDYLKQLAVGGNEYGHHTLTRFFALHAGVLPGAMMGLIALHLAMFRKYGVTAVDADKHPDADFWPDQVLKDGVACLAVLLTVCGLSYWMGAELGAPADPSLAYNAARPEWYYLFLFQFLKFFKGETGEFLGAQVIPGLVFGLMMLMPIIGRWKLGHRFNVAFLLILMLGAGGLTAAALYEDRNGETQKSKDFLAAVELAHAEGERAQELASEGIPPEGALKLVREDTKIAGLRLFERNCAVCHTHYDINGQITDPLRTIHSPDAVASNLFGFGSRAWMQGMLDAEQVAGEHYFGRTIHAEGDMVTWVRDNIRDGKADLEGEELAEFEQQVELVAMAISAEAKLGYQQSQDKTDAAKIVEGRDLAINQFACTDCHKLGDEGYLGTAPDLTGYASRQWLIDFIANPQVERFYLPDNYDETERMMPGFAVHADKPALNKLSQQELGLIADWLRQEWFEAEVEQPLEASVGVEAEETREEPAPGQG